MPLLLGELLHTSALEFLDVLAAVLPCCQMNVLEAEVLLIFPGRLEGASKHLESSQCVLPFEGSSLGSDKDSSNISCPHFFS